MRSFKDPFSCLLRFCADAGTQHGFSIYRENINKKLSPRQSDHHKNLEAD